MSVSTGVCDRCKETRQGIELMTLMAGYTAVICPQCNNAWTILCMSGGRLHPMVRSLQDVSDSYNTYLAQTDSDAVDRSKNLANARGTMEEIRHQLFDEASAWVREGVASQASQKTQAAAQPAQRKAA